MSILMRISQQFDPANEREFMELERKFAELERNHPGFPEGKRMQPVSSSLPVNTLIWQCEFPDIETAYNALDFFNNNEEHEKLFGEQSVFMKEIRIEFFRILDF